MKKLACAIVIATLSLCASAQGTSLPASTPKTLPLDKSPLDMAYFPEDYPVLKIKDKAKEPLVARVIYS